MTTITTPRNTGVSFQPKSKYPGLFANDIKPVSIGGNEVTTAAQAMTLIAYGDSHKLPVRSLDYKVQCEGFKDFAACIAIIDSYNEFDAGRISRAASRILNLSHYLNENNSNNGKDFFGFHIAREGSPAFYISWNEKFNSKVITKREAVSLPEEGENLHWEEYTAEDFKSNMAKFSNAILADEFSIEETYVYGDGQKSYTARFWFD